MIGALIVPSRLIDRLEEQVRRLVVLMCVKSRTIHALSRSLPVDQRTICRHRTGGEECEYSGVLRAALPLTRRGRGCVCTSIRLCASFSFSKQVDDIRVLLWTPSIRSAKSKS